MGVPYVSTCGVQVSRSYGTYRNVDGGGTELIEVWGSGIDFLPTGTGPRVRKSKEAVPSLTEDVGRVHLSSIEKTISRMGKNAPLSGC